MKGHLPVAVVSKFDALIEKKNERFRRDGFVMAFMGLAGVFSTIFAPLGASFLGISNIFILAMGVFCLFASVGYFLVYRRSLEPRNRPRNAPLVSKASPIEIQGNDAPAITQKLRPVDTYADGAESFYCPSCGLQNPVTASYCRNCQTTLLFAPSPRGIDRYLPAFVINRMDAAIAKNEEQEYKPHHKSGSAILGVAAIFLLNMVLRGIQGDWGSVVVYLALGLSLIVTSSWNLVAYRRHAGTEVPSSGDGSEANPSAFPLSSKIATVVLFASLGVAYAGVADWWPVALIALIVIAANYLRSWQSRRARESVDETVSAAELRLLDTQDALPFLEPPSVTEGTTKHLDAVTKRIEKRMAVNSGELL